MTAQLALPWYVHPAEDPGAWSRLAAGDPTPSFVVVNVHDGPGRVDDPYYPDAVASLSRHRVVGYVPLRWGARPVADVLGDVGAWVHRYGLTGVMLDEFPSRGPVAAWLPVVQAARDLGAHFVVGNPGVVPEAAHLEALDVTCVFEGTADDHARSLPAPELDGVPPDRVWHLVHTCRPGDLEAVTRRAVSLGAGHVFATDRRLPHPWGGMPISAEPVMSP